MSEEKKKTICDLVDEWEMDEKKANKEYAQKSVESLSKEDAYALMKMSKDEGDHAKLVAEMKAKCKRAKLKKSSIKK